MNLKASFQCWDHNGKIQLRSVFEEIIRAFQSDHRELMSANWIVGYLQQINDTIYCNNIFSYFYYKSSHLELMSVH